MLSKVTERYTKSTGASITMSNGSTNIDITEYTVGSWFK